MTVKSVALLCLLALFAWAKPAQAAKSFDQCQYYVDSLPVTITLPGTWCLRKDLKVTGAMNTAINIQSGDTTLDCKDFTLDGTAISPDQAQWGILSNAPDAVTVRNCNVKGFLFGISFYNSESKGNLIVDNELTRNYGGGIQALGDGSLVSRNLVRNTGGVSDPAAGITVWGNVTVIDNLVSDVRSTANNVTGISANDFTGTIVNNRIRGLSQGIVSHPSVGISIVGAINATVRDNDISGDGLPITAGIWCRFATGRIRGNVIKGMQTPIMDCDLGQENDIGQ